MLIKQCDICGKQGKHHDPASFELRSIRTVEEAQNLIMPPYEKSNVITGDTVIEDNIVKIIKAHLKGLRCFGKVSYICSDCIEKMKENLEKYYINEAKKAIPELFDEKFYQKNTR